MSDLIAAATVIPLRDTPQGPEVLMLRKNSKLAFGGMWVFPGGKLDPDDDDPGLPGDVEAASRRAAVREALEEADLLVEPDSLVPFSHWTPPEVSMNGPKRFATWFFVCRAPVGEAGEVTIDGGEIHEECWVRPVEMLGRLANEEIQLAPPTIVTLHDLARHDDVDAVLADSASRTPEHFLTKVGTVGESVVTMWAGDVGYDSGDATLDGPRHRIVMGPGPWTYENTLAE